MNQVVARFLDGSTQKGETGDFLPTKGVFHLTIEGPSPGRRTVEIQVAQLKALYFVRRLEGNPQHHKSNEFDPRFTTPGRRVKVIFKDGEVLVGTTQAYQPGRPGFFLVPADPDSNNERCFVVLPATESVSYI